MVRVETREIARSQISLVLVGSSENLVLIPRVRDNIEEFKLEEGRDIVGDTEGWSGKMISAFCFQHAEWVRGSKSR